MTVLHAAFDREMHETVARRGWQVTHARSLRADRAARRAFLACAAAAVLLIALVVIFLVANASPVVRNGALGQFFASTHWDPDAGIAGSHQPSFGALAPILGSIVAVTGALLLAVPLSLAVAMFMVDLHPHLGRRVVRPAVEVLAGIPSVVFGYLGFTILVPLLTRFAPPGKDGSGTVAAAVVLAFMIMPTIASVAAEGFAAVPIALREGAMSLGATQWQVLRLVVLPAARGRVVTGVVLGLARALGEALAVSMVIGDINVIPSVARDGIRALFAPFTTMTVTITDGVDSVALNPTGTAARYALAVLLLFGTFACVSAIHRLQRRGV